MKAENFDLTLASLLKTSLKASLIVVLSVLTACNGKQPEAQNEEKPEELASVEENNSTVTEFVEFIESDTNKMTLDHAFTNEALHKLIEATNAMAKEIDYDVKADMDEVEQYADRITEDPFETTHADNIRRAANVITGALMKMQQQKFPDLSSEADQLKNACSEINPEVLTLDQKDAVKTFFNEASAMLEEMN